MAQTAIMRFLRKRMKAIFWITAVVFIGLIVFGWGMDITGTRGRGGIKHDIAGKVDDYEVTFNMYREVLEREYDRVYREGKALTEAETEMMTDMAFFILTNRKIFQDQIKSKGVDAITNREVFEAARRRPPEEILQAKAFQRDGKFDQALYEQALRNPEIQEWVQLEEYIRSVIPLEKLKFIVNAIPVMSELEAKNEYAFRNDQARATYIKIDPYSVDKIEIDTSESTIKSYYEKNKEKYRVKESVVLNYAKLVVVPTSEDSAIAYAEAESLKTRIERGEDFAELASYYSDDLRSKRNGGAIGWIRKGFMLKPFDNVAFNTDTGKIAGPVLSDAGYHIIKVHDRRGEGDTLFINVSHILLEIEPGMSAEDSAKKRISELIHKTSDGEDFFEIASALGLDSVGQSPPIERKGTVPGIGYRGKVDWWMFNDSIKSIESFPVKISDTPPLEGYVVLQIAGRNPDGVLPLELVRGRIVTDIVMEARKNSAIALAQKVADLVNSGMEFAKSAKEFGLKIDTTGTFNRRSWIEGVGDDPVFKGTVFGLKTPGNFSKPFIGDGGNIYLVRLDSITPADPAQYYVQRVQIKNEVLGIYKQDFYDNWFKNNRNKANIVDYRFIEREGPQDAPIRMPDADF